jgi:hypothetical protein
MQILASVVMLRERKMLGALTAAGTEGSTSSVMGNTTLSAHREHLNYRLTSVQRNRVSPYRSPKCGVGSRKANNGGADRRSERKPMLLCNRADIGCVDYIDNITERESELISLRCCTRESFINRLKRQSR